MQSGNRANLLNSFGGGSVAAFGGSGTLMLGGSSAGSSMTMNGKSYVQNGNGKWVNVDEELVHAEKYTVVSNAGPLVVHHRNGLYRVEPSAPLRGPHRVSMTSSSGALTSGWRGERMVFDQSATVLIDNVALNYKMPPPSPQVLESARPWNLSSEGFARHLADLDRITDNNQRLHLLSVWTGAAALSISQARSLMSYFDDNYKTKALEKLLPLMQHLGEDAIAHFLLIDVRLDIEAAIGHLTKTGSTLLGLSPEIKALYWSHATPFIKATYLRGLFDVASADKSAIQSLFNEIWKANSVSVALACDVTRILYPYGYTGNMEDGLAAMRVCSDEKLPEVAAVMFPEGWIVPRAFIVELLNGVEKGVVCYQLVSYLLGRTVSGSYLDSIDTLDVQGIFDKIWATNDVTITQACEATRLLYPIGYRGGYSQALNAFKVTGDDRKDDVFEALFPEMRDFPVTFIANLMELTKSVRVRETLFGKMLRVTALSEPDAAMIIQNASEPHKSALRAMINQARNRTVRAEPRAQCATSYAVSSAKPAVAAPVSPSERLAAQLELAENLQFDSEPPEYLKDQIISLGLIHEAVITPNGDTYDRRVIEEWIERKHTCPVTMEALSVTDLRPNRGLQRQIDAWKAAHVMTSKMPAYSAK